MPAIFDVLYQAYCRARLAEMRKQLLISPARHEIAEAICDMKDGVGANSAGNDGEWSRPVLAETHPS
jgi:hypothetical protein